MANTSYAPTFEINVDGLVGPTHHYAGLSPGNLASEKHKHQTSNPKAAALQGLSKMKCLMDLGIKQMVLPPHPRPSIAYLKQLGFRGNDTQILKQVKNQSPGLLSANSSASSMWAANSATVSPSCDTADARMHITPANLYANLHRAIETNFTATLLKRLLPDTRFFAHHQPLFACQALSDEGAANHTFLSMPSDQPGQPEKLQQGVELFCFGGQTQRYPARQTLLACQTIARLHLLDQANVLFVEQNPLAIDAGVFHNDVICVGHQHVLLYHALAFAEGDKPVEQLGKMLDTLIPIQIAENDVSLADAVSTYLFNSQLITSASDDAQHHDAPMHLLCPIECQKHAGVKKAIDQIIADANNPIAHAHYIDLRQSMCNGGGPACLRLRLNLTEPQWASVHPGTVLTEQLFDALVDWVNHHYRQQLTVDDLGDVTLLNESRVALSELAEILDLQGVYKKVTT